MTDAQQTFIPKLLLFLTLLFLMSCEEITDELSTNGSTNVAPVANAQAVTLDEDSIKSIVLTATDSDDDTLTYKVITSPTNGALSGSAPNLTYTPNANYNGTDSFSFKVNDGTVDSETVNITLTITAINDAPTASMQAITVAEGGTASVTLSGTDMDNDTLTYTLVTQPSNGTLTGTAPNLVYIPNANYIGTDSFSFNVNDGTLDSAAVSITITVTAKVSNNAPTAIEQTLTLNEDSSKTIVLSAADVDSPTLTYTVVSQPSNGVLTGTAPNLTYTPNGNYNGSDSFSFKASDGTTDSETVIVTLNITPIADVTATKASIAEGNSGTSNLVFTLTLDAYEDVATVDYITQDGTATTADNDYVSTTGTVTFSSGSKSETVTVLINGDTRVEKDETFNLNLSNANNIQISTSTVTGTILNDDSSLNDTGVTWAGEYASGNKSLNDCTTTTIAGNQDCHVGRDATNNDNSDGLAGFSFTKLDATGAVLADQSVTNHACVKDNVTGLIWEVKSTNSASEQYNFNTYQWGGLSAIGRDNANKEGTYYDAWNVLVNYVNDTNDANTTAGPLCGFSDWRVPKVEELRSIVHYGKTNPAIDENYFPNTRSRIYWSATPYSSSASVAMWVGFDYGDDDANIGRSTGAYVRLVRGAP